MTIKPEIPVHMFLTRLFLRSKQTQQVPEVPNSVSAVKVVNMNVTLHENLRPKENSSPNLTIIKPINKLKSQSWNCQLCYANNFSLFFYFSSSNFYKETITCFLSSSSSIKIEKSKIV